MLVHLLLIPQYYLVFFLKIQKLLFFILYTLILVEIGINFISKLAVFSNHKILGEEKKNAICKK